MNYYSVDLPYVDAVCEELLKLKPELKNDIIKLSDDFHTQISEYLSNCEHSNYWADELKYWEQLEKFLTAVDGMCNKGFFKKVDSVELNHNLGCIIYGASYIKQEEDHEPTPKLLKGGLDFYRDLIRDVRTAAENPNFDKPFIFDVALKLMYDSSKVNFDKNPNEFGKKIRRRPELNDEIINDPDYWRTGVNKSGETVLYVGTSPNPNEDTNLMQIEWYGGRTDLKFQKNNNPDNFISKNQLIATIQNSKIPEENKIAILDKVCDFYGIKNNYELLKKEESTNNHNPLPQCGG